MKKDYIKGFAEKCAEHGVSAKELVKEASKMKALTNLLESLKDTYEGSSVQGAISDIGEGAGDAYDAVADSDIAKAIGGAGKATGGAIVDAGKATGEGVMFLVEKLKNALSGLKGD